MAPLAFALGLWVPQEDGQVRGRDAIPRVLSPSEAPYTPRSNSSSELLEGGLRVKWSVRLSPIVEWKRHASEATTGLQEGDIVQPISIMAILATAEGAIELGTIHMVAFKATGDPRSLGASLGGEYQPDGSKEFEHVEGFLTIALAEGVEDWVSVRASEDITVRWEKRN